MLLEACRHTDRVTTPAPCGDDVRAPDRIRVGEADPQVLHIEGEADLAAVEDLADLLEVERTEVGRLLAARGIEEVDLRRATFIDSTTIALLVAIGLHRRPAPLRIKGASGSPLDTLRLTGVDAVLDLQT